MANRIGLRAPIRSDLARAQDPTFEGRRPAAVANLAIEELELRSVVDLANLVAVAGLRSVAVVAGLLVANLVALVAGGQRLRAVVVAAAGGRGIEITVPRARTYALRNFYD